MGYLTELSQYYSPWYWLHGISHERASASSPTGESTRLDRFVHRLKVLSEDGPGRLRSLRYGTLILLLKALGMLRYVIPLGLFVLRCRQWWQQVGSSRYRALMMDKSIPPPLLPPSHQKGLSVPGKGLCPLCRQRRQQAVALPSGYLFCHDCIRTHLRDHPRCPVTLLPYTLSDIRPVYDHP